MAPVDENDLVQHLFHIGDQVGGNDHGGVGIIIGNNGGENIIPCGGVHAADGLVQQIQPGGPAHDHNELNLFPGALAHLLDPLLGLDVQMVKHLLRSLTAEVRVEILVKIHELTGAHPGGDGGALRQIADHGVGLPARGPAVDQNFPAAGGQQAIGQLDEGGLAAAVGT